MTGSQLAALVQAEIRRARLRLRFETRPNSIGLFVLLWSDWSHHEGIGGRRVQARDAEMRRREASIAVQVFHSRVPRVSWRRHDGRAEDLWPPTRAPAPVIAALVCHAIAQVGPTARRRREAERRLQEAGVQLSDFRRKPSFTRRRLA